MDFDAESLQKHIPLYLTDPAALKREIRAFIRSGNGETREMNYFLPSSHDRFKNDMLQGDIWSGFQTFIFSSGERKAIKGIVLSNTCDTSPENKRDLSRRVTFAPIMKLNAIQNLYEQSKLDKTAISAKITAIKSQEVTSMFYLPAGGVLNEDYVARLDEVHSMPLSAHKPSSKILTLNNFGFYLFVVKLSIHFCRFQENVDRNAATENS